MNFVVACILVYILLQLAVVFIISRRPRSESDYLLAGRSLGPWLSTFGVFATWFGAETCIGATGEAYRGGLRAVTSDPFGYTVGLVLCGLFFGAALWKRRLTTLADLFRQRYGIGVERLAALIMIPSSLLWAAAQVRAFGQVLASVSEFQVLTATTIAAAVVIAYTAVGGMWADSVTDLVQGVVVILGLFALLAIFAIAGGFGGIEWTAHHGAAVAAAEAPRPLIEALAVPIFGTIAAQELTARILAMRSVNLARYATAGAGLMYLAVGIVPVLLGLGAARFLGADAEPEQVLSRLAQSQLPQPLYILFLGALVSAILSTLSGALLVAGSLAAHNIAEPLRGAKLTEADKLRFNRIAVVVFGVIAYGIALSAEGMYALVEEASGLGSSGVFVLIVFSLWLPRIGRSASAAAALVASVATFMLGSHVFGWSYPYVASLGAALVAYLMFALVPGRTKVRHDEPVSV
jgi:Na+/proline symporter